MASKKIIPINYTNREFETIKGDLIEYAKRYYPNTYKDFNEASFGALMLDTVAYVGDMLSFYLDYQANESFLSTAIDPDNVIKLSKTLGFKYKGVPSSSGIATFYILIPAKSTGLGADSNYLPILKKGTQIANEAGASYILNENINFADPNNLVVVAQNDATTGLPTSYAVKASGQVISGILEQESFVLGDYKKFKSLQLAASNVVEVLSVTDTAGHEYYEVDALSQNVIYKTFENKNNDKFDTPYVLKAVPVPRRFIVERHRDDIFLQFGYGSEDNLTSEVVVDPANVILNTYGKDYITDTTFDPTNLIKTDKLGVVPTNTTLTVIYRTNTTENVNAPVGSVTIVEGTDFSWPDAATNSATIQAAISSLECTNEEPILGDLALPTVDELKIKAIDTFMTQNRAVTKQDYMNLCYSMPTKLGSLKRVNIVQDKDSFKRNLNLYVIAENSLGFFITANDTLKDNLKTWLLNYKMLNDTIDILDAKIVNVGIDIEIITLLGKNKYDVLEDALSALKDRFDKKFEIGESIYLSDVYTTVNRIDGVLDTTSVRITAKPGVNYSQAPFDIVQNTSADGRYVSVPEDYVLEIKFPEDDIRGAVK